MESLPAGLAFLQARLRPDHLPVGPFIENRLAGHTADFAASRIHSSQPEPRVMIRLGDVARRAMKSIALCLASLPFLQQVLCL